jgi:UDP-glucose 4-epimerase
MTTVVVTGGAGFIGSHVCDRLLAEGRRVVAVDDLSTGHIPNLTEARSYGKSFAFHNLDVRAPGLTRIFGSIEPEVVIHLAARREHGGRLDPAADVSVALLGLLNVLEASVAAEVRKIVVAVPDSIYGDPRKVPVRETSEAGARPLTPAAISAKAGEDYLRFYQRYRGLDHTALVLGSVYGPRQYPADGAGVVASLAGAMLSGDVPAIAGDGNQTRDFIFVDDAVHAIALATDRGAGRLINVGTGLETSVNALCRLLAGITGYRGDPRFAPAEPGQARRAALDSTLAEQELGWRPWTHLEDGLRETVAFLRAD